MKYNKIKNNTRQGLEIIIKDGKGEFSHVWLESRKSIVVPSHCLTDLVKRAAKRELVSIMPVQG